MRKIAIYPGTFDPITYGHIDVIRKSLSLVDNLIIGVSNSSNKKYLFNADERIEIIKIDMIKIIIFKFVFKIGSRLSDCTIKVLLTKGILNKLNK